MDPGVPGYKNGPVDSLAIAESIIKINTGARMRGTANAAGAYKLATLSREIPESLLASNDQQLTDIVDRITDETQLEGKSLTASGGWCAPSEVIYDFLETTPATDLVDLPEFGIARGGVRFPEQPEFSAIYDAFKGFDYTEAQLIAAEADQEFQKPCVEVPCGDMEEVRLDAIGLCITNGILSAKAWPERTKKYVDEIMKAHLHRISARTITKIVAGSTSVSVPSANLIGALAAILNVLELAAVDARTKHRLPATTTIEGEAPTWLKPLVRADLAYRKGLDEIQVTDAMIDSWLALRGIRLQFVVDFQPLGGAGGCDGAPVYGSGHAVPGGHLVPHGGAGDRADCAVRQAQLPSGGYPSLIRGGRSVRTGHASCCSASGRRVVRPEAYLVRGSRNVRADPSAILRPRRTHGSYCAS